MIEYLKVRLTNENWVDDVFSALSEGTDLTASPYVESSYGGNFWLIDRDARRLRRVDPLESIFYQVTIKMDLGAPQLYGGTGKFLEDFGTSIMRSVTIHATRSIAIDNKALNSVFCNRSIKIGSIELDFVTGLLISTPAAIALYPKIREGIAFAVQDADTFRKWALKRAKQRPKVEDEEDEK